MDEASTEAERLAVHDVARLRADNAGPLTLSGTNTWLVGRDPTWVVDPGPGARRARAPAGRGGRAARRPRRVALTHGHADHRGALGALLDSPARAGRGSRADQADVPLADGVRFGPFEVFATPGHARDHVALIAHDACFTGDAVLGEGSVFVAPYPGAMAAYLDALTRLAARGELLVLCPGHGPPGMGSRRQARRDHRSSTGARARALAALRAACAAEDELLDAVMVGRAAPRCARWPRSRWPRTWTSSPQRSAPARGRAAPALHGWAGDIDW